MYLHGYLQVRAAYDTLIFVLFIMYYMRRIFPLILVLKLPKLGHSEVYKQC